MKILHKINYWQDMPNEPEWDEETGEMIDTGVTRQYREAIEDPASENYPGLIERIKGFCGDDYTITEIWQEVGVVERIRADVDYIAMMAGVDLDV